MFSWFWKKIGFIFQDNYLLPEYNVLENLIIPQLIIGKKYQDSKNNAMNMLSLFELNSLILRHSNEISEGEKQRIALIRSIINEPEIVIAVWLPITCIQTIVKASICVGLILPGIIEEPGSFSGNKSSPNPDLGPEAKKRKSFVILNKETAIEFKAAERFTIESWAAIDSNLLLEGKYL